MDIIKDYHDKKWTLQFLDDLYNNIDLLKKKNLLFVRRPIVRYSDSDPLGPNRLESSGIFLPGHGVFVQAH
jgi:hypothetical protein